MQYPMNSIGVIDCLKDEITDIIKNFQLKCNVGDIEKEPKVIEMFLHEKKSKSDQLEDPDFPHVIVRFVEETCKNRANIVEVQIIAGTVAEEPQQGWRDVMNILNRIKMELMKQRLLGSMFTMVEDSYKTFFPEEQLLPYWLGYSIVHYELPEVQDEGSALLVY